MTPHNKSATVGFKGMEPLICETKARGGWLVREILVIYGWDYMMFLFWELYFVHMTLVSTYELCGTLIYYTHIISMLCNVDRQEKLCNILTFFFSFFFFELYIFWRESENHH